MGQLWRHLGLASLVGLAALGGLLILDPLLASLLPSHNPDAAIWLATGLAAAGGGLALSWQTGRQPRRLLLGAAVGAGVFLVLLGAIQAYVGAGAGGAYHPTLGAEVPMNGSWEPSEVAQVLEAGGYRVVTANEAVVEAERSEEGMTTWLQLRPAATGTAGPNGTDVVLTLHHRPTEALPTSTAASTWMETHRDDGDGRLAGLLVNLQLGLGWEPVAPPTYDKDLAVG